MHEKGIIPIQIGNNAFMSFEDALNIKNGIKRSMKKGNTNPSIKDKSIDIEFNLRPKICKVLNPPLKDCLVKKLNIKTLGIFMFFNSFLTALIIIASGKLRVALAAFEERTTEPALQYVLC